jgi:PKD repeat protein
MESRVDWVRVFVRGGVVFSLVALLGLSTGDGGIRAADIGAAELPAIDQAGRAAGGIFDPAAEAARQHEVHARLVAERPEGAAERPLTVELTKEERAELGRTEDGTRKLRVGTVKPLNARIRFDDLQPSDLRGRVAREHGVVQATADGGLVWTAVIRSAGAAALRLRIDAFFLPPQSELWIYTAAGETHGPYTSAGPEGTREFWTHAVSGSEASLQLRKRGPVTPRDLRQLGFVIADVAHIDDASLRGGDGPDAAPSAGFCSFNASCVVSGECAGSSWDDVRNAVASIRFVSGPWVYICSGGLVADAGASGTPYFLTANHCISRSGEASSMEAFFRFRSTSCGSTTGCSGPDSSVPRTRGATILSTNKTSDYTLLRLSEAAPSGSYFLGWTATAVANTNNTQLFRFSHPKGSPQAYSAHVVDTSKPTCTSWPRGNWIYSRDIEGATEGGSSGSPVVNGQGLIVGQLSGACGYNVNDTCDSASNATVDGAFASYYSSVSQYLGPGASNQPPVASFVYTCNGLTCDFNASSSSDPDGSISGYAWSFGDGSSGSGQTVSRTYATDGTYTVTLTVTDNNGATASTSQPVTVSKPPPGGISLTATGYKERGLQKAELLWSGATSASVDVRRDNSTIATVANSGSYVDNINQRGGGSYTYQVCEAGTSTCSASVSVTF